uniref:Family with sequence similarity 210 member B n=1 Tax=Eptatretus burgeri TaxID=7764 RepID=A0A8C4QA37_EPTBU
MFLLAESGRTVHAARVTWRLSYLLGSAWGPVRVPCRGRAARARPPRGSTVPVQEELQIGRNLSARAGDQDGNQADEKKIVVGEHESRNVPNKRQRLKQLFKDYGAVAVSFHVSISLLSLGACYTAVSSGVDVSKMLQLMRMDEAMVHSQIAAGTSTFLIAYAVHKLLAPLRISTTLVSVPFIVHYLRQARASRNRSRSL